MDEKYNDNCTLCDCSRCLEQCSNCITCNGAVTDETNKTENENWVENCNDCVEV